jgi:hypothetical protein
VYKALVHYRPTRGGLFVSVDIGLTTACWSADASRAPRVRESETVEA